ERQSRILVVDDDTDLCANLRKILEMHDYAVDIACNANDGIALCRATQYDIALVDIQLGADSGHDLVETLAQISPSTEWIFMTAYASLESAIEAVKQEHVVSYETKPLNLDRLLALIKQIIKRKQAEETLRESEEKYRSLITNIPDVIWTTDHEGNTTFLSQNIAAVYGYTPEEIYEAGSQLWLGRIHPEDVEHVTHALEALFEAGQLFDIEYRIKRKDGEWIWAHDRS
ncbi:MAG: PAS domain-containing protein, partial [Gammaproteobacteria bacterium]|nr:PAS domain-containing protein [Gammaproteobacteria bacterium]